MINIIEIMGISKELKKYLKFLPKKGKDDKSLILNQQIVKLTAIGEESLHILKNNYSFEIAKNVFFHADCKLIERIPDSSTLFISCLLGDIKFLFFSSNDNYMFFKTDEGTILMTDFYYGIMLQMFSQKLYTLPPQLSLKNYIVVDIGMNRGYSSLWFAQDIKCKKVFAFEIDKDTFQFALKNFDLNEHLNKKIKAFDYGLSNRDGDIKLNFIPGEDSVSTIDKNFSKNYYSEERKSRMKQKDATVKKTSTTIKKLITRYKIKDPMILKIDVEGAEYDIINDLIDNHLINRFSLIIGESHNGLEPLTKSLKNFELITETRVTEQLSNFCFINKTIKQ